MSDAPTSEPVGPCQPWAGPEDIPVGWTSCAERAEDDLALAFAVATELLWAWDGRKLPGICDVMDSRPCSRQGAPTNAPVWFVRFSPGGPSSPWRGCGCSGRLSRSCSCAGPSEVQLLSPIESIGAVRIDGETLDPAAYRVDDDRWLVRLPDPDDPLERPRSWPCCPRVDLPSDQPDTWAIDFSYGHAVPLSARMACVSMACELAKGWAGDESCKLPDTVTSYTRENTTVTLQRPGDDVIAQLPRDVRLFLEASNPLEQHQPATVWSPDVGTIRIPST